MASIYPRCKNEFVLQLSSVGYLLWKIVYINRCLLDFAFFAGVELAFFAFFAGVVLAFFIRSKSNSSSVPESLAPCTLGTRLGPTEFLVTDLLLELGLGDDESVPLGAFTFWLGLCTPDSFLLDTSDFWLGLGPHDSLLLDLSDFGLGFPSSWP